MKTSPSKTVSVLICSLNGASRIGACIKSVYTQTIDTEHIECIVVDDGSTDDTAQVATVAGAQVIRLETNKGIPIARNTALAASTGEIVVFIDDDCIADPFWLERLITIFTNDDTVAAGGKISAYRPMTLSERYMEASGYGNPPHPSAIRISGILGRLIRYIDTMFHPIMEETAPIATGEAYTANAAYRRSVIMQVGGFDETLRTGEDSEISARLRRIGKIMYVPDAIVYHQHYTTLQKVIGEPYRRSRDAFLTYAKQKSMPPIFPMACIFFVICFLIITSFISGKFIFVFLPILILSPIILYVWWPFRAIKEKHAEYILYPYIQLAIESGVMIGFLVAFIHILYHPKNMSS
ncbi:MAG: glycosyltransferase [Candidatus Yonathbacteria bacterium]|nr:glycosyltransferase [Candidatus Yonathbacteria bacterium]NTW47938.1 glycosyltransferase [Candidatus Yonathbacteria bacterium]